MNELYNVGDVSIRYIDGSIIGTVNMIEQFNVGDRVVHYRDDSLVGTIVFVEDNNLSCMIEWDGDPYWDFQWSNKLLNL